MLKQWLFYVCLLIHVYANAQDSNRIFITAGQSLNDAVIPSKIYRYPAFVLGKTFFRDGTQTDALLNYNFLNGEVEFIALNGDTLAIAKNQMPNISKIIIDTSWFYYNNGYLEEVIADNGGKLLKKQQFKVAKREKIGGYDQPTSTAAIDSYGSFINNGEVNFNLKVRENITLIKQTDYYFGDQYNTFLRASKKNLLRLFSKQHQKIESYLRFNPVDFKNEQDLRRLMLFLQTA